MKRILALSLLSAIALVTASRPALAAAPKEDARSAAVASALLAVSPDPLGGRLGLAVTASRSSERSVVRSATETPNISDSDRQAYVAWKKSAKRS